MFSHTYLSGTNRDTEFVRIIDSTLLHHILESYLSNLDMSREARRQKTVVVGAGPVGALAALYAAQRNHYVEIYELRSGTFCFPISSLLQF